VLVATFALTLVFVSAHDCVTVNLHFSPRGLTRRLGSIRVFPSLTGLPF
jgi:hypothetical protein